jgi:hypothetical protein
MTKSRQERRANNKNNKNNKNTKTTREDTNDLITQGIVVGIYQLAKMEKEGENFNRNVNLILINPLEGSIAGMNVPYCEEAIKDFGELFTKEVTKNNEMIGFGLVINKEGDVGVKVISCSKFWNDVDKLVDFC